MTSVALLAVMLAAEVDVRSSTHCPSAEDVLAHLAPLLPAREDRAQTSRDSATIEITAMAPDGTSELRVELTGRDGVLIGERRVAGRGTCADRAEAVAAVLAAWETDPAPAMVAEPTGIEGRTSDATAAKVPPAELPPKRHLEVTVAAGGGVALVGGWAGAATAWVAAGWTGSHWQLQIDGAVERNRRIDLHAGYVDWHHTTAGVALGYRTLSSRLVFATALGAVAGWASLAGNDWALRLLDETSLGNVAASRSLRLTRAGLRAAAGRCAEALADYEGVLAAAGRPDERALRGRDACRKQLSQSSSP